MHTIPHHAALTRSLRAIVFTAFIAASPAWANDAAKAPAKSGERAMPAIGESMVKTDITPGLAGSFLAGRFARGHEDLSEAAQYLGETLARDPSNEPLMHETMRINLLAGNTAKAIELARKMADEANDDPLIATILMLDQVQKGDYVRAEKFVVKTADEGLYGVIKPVLRSWLNVGSGELVGSADLQAAIDKSGFFAPFITYHQALMNDVLGNDQLARESYLKASADPAITPYRVVEAMSNFYQRHDQWKEAQEVYDQYATANPDSTLIPDKILKRSGEIEPMVGSASEGLSELFFTTASILFGEESSQETFLYLRIALALRPNNPPAQLMLANLYEQMQDYAAAIRIYDSITPGTVFYRRGQIRKALNYEAMGKQNLALKLLARVAEVNPKDNSALITMGDMLREQEKFEEAAGAYTDAIARAEPLKNSDWPLLYARGISFERDGEWGKAEADFERALKLEPNQPDVLNYLAYSWLLMNENIGKAREYLEIAASARPEDAHIIDSLGWAHYLSGDYSAAVEHLEKAADLMPDDPTVNDHLGDAYWRVGRKIEAKFQWQRALNFKPEEPVAEIIRGKLDHGLSPFMPQQQSNASMLQADPAVRVQ